MLVTNSKEKEPQGRTMQNETDKIVSVGSEVAVGAAVIVRPISTVNP